MRVLVKAIDEGPYASKSLVEQDGRIEIVELAPRIREEREKAEQQLIAVEEEIKELRRSIRVQEGRCARLLRDLERARGRLGAYTRVYRYWLREVERASALYMTGARPTPYLVRWLRRRLRRIGIEAPIEAVREYFSEYLETYLIEAIRRMEMWRDYARRTREDYVLAREQWVKCYMELEGLRGRLSELEREYAALITVVEELRKLEEKRKIIYVTDVEHIEMEVTVAMETGKGHEALLAEVTFRTLLRGADKLRNLDEYVNKLEWCALLSTWCLFKAVAGVAEEIMRGELETVWIKEGVRFIYYDVPKTSAEWPKVEMDGEYGHMKPDDYEALVRIKGGKLLETGSLSDYDHVLIRGRNPVYGSGNIYSCEPYPELCTGERVIRIRKRGWWYYG